MKKLKGYVRNKAKLEGSIVEGYVAEEALTFSSHYFLDVTMKFNRPDRNVDPPPLTCQFQEFRSLCKSIDLQSVIRFDAQELKKVIWYVLHNSPEIDTYQSQFKSRDEHRTAQNSGICLPGGKDGEMYYGQLQEILEFSYFSFKVVLFRVKWLDTSNEGRTVKHLVLRNNMTQILTKDGAFKDVQYILATQVKQCFYLEDMARRQPYWKVIEHVNHKKFLDGGVIVVEEDPDVIHSDNSSDLPLSTSLNDLDDATLHIDGQSTEVDAPSYIIDLDEDDGISDDEDALPHDLADSDDEDLVNVDDDDGVEVTYIIYELIPARVVKLLQIGVKTESVESEILCGYLGQISNIVQGPRFEITVIALVLVGIAVSYGLFSSKRNDQPKTQDKEDEHDQHAPLSYVSRLLQVSSSSSSIFDDDDDEKKMVENNSKVVERTWNLQYYRGEPPIVVVAKESSSSIDDANTTIEKLCYTSGSSFSFSTGTGKRRFSRNLSCPKDEESKEEDNIVLRSPVQWRSRSGRMQLRQEEKEEIQSKSLHEDVGVRKTMYPQSLPAPLPPPPLPPPPPPHCIVLLNNNKIKMNTSTRYAPHNQDSQNRERQGGRLAEDVTPTHKYHRSLSQDKEIESFIKTRGGSQNNNNMDDEDEADDDDDDTQTQSFTEYPKKQQRQASASTHIKDSNQSSSSSSEDEEDDDDDDELQELASTKNNEAMNEEEMMSGSDHIVDKKADEFIAKFREQIRLQRIASIRTTTSTQGPTTTRKSRTGDQVFPGDICLPGNVTKRQKSVRRGINSDRLFSQSMNRVSRATCRPG
ncbi:alpha/beta hydrolases superfamily protein [Tanacetum coccineum]